MMAVLSAGMYAVWVNVCPARVRVTSADASSSARLRMAAEISAVQPSRRALRRDTDTLHKHVRQLLNDDRARDAAIGIVVIRNVQGGILPETVVHLDGQRMFAVGQVAHDCLKRGERAVVPGDFIAIQQDACAEGYAAEIQADIAPAANAGRVVRAPAVVVERRDKLPCAGDGQPCGTGAVVSRAAKSHSVGTGTARRI